MTDAGGGRNSFAVKENNHNSEKAVGHATLGNAQKIKINEASSASRYGGGSIFLYAHNVICCCTIKYALLRCTCD